MSRGSEETLSHEGENGHVRNGHDDWPADGREKGEKKPEEHGPVGFWHS